jgi:DnaK suppressor protein
MTAKKKVPAAKKPAAKKPAAKPGKAATAAHKAKPAAKKAPAKAAKHPPKAAGKASKPAKAPAKAPAKPLTKQQIKAAAAAAQPRVSVRVMLPKVAPFTRPAALQSSNGPAKPVAGKASAKAVKAAPAATMMPSGPRGFFKLAPKPAPAPKRVAVSTAVGLPNGIKPYKTRKDEPYMNDAQRAHFEQILLAWKRSLMEEVDRTVHHMQDEAANFPDPNDRATQESEFSLELRTRDRERKLIKKIDEAIASLKQDEYGYCEDCGAEIGVQRLEARPTATQCIDCKTLDEIREKQMGG